MLRTAGIPLDARRAVEPWRDHWFPVAFAVDVVPGQLHRVTIHDIGYVLFHDSSGRIRAFEDQCPHRMARLSDGRLRGGEVECLYHGWRFAADGSCTHIPQLEAGRTPPSAACAKSVPVLVRQGMVWMHGLGLDDGMEATQELQLPLVEDLETEKCDTIDFAIDLPYGQEFLVENVLDYAHIHIAHDGVRGGGHGALAGPLAFDIDEVTKGGFTARFGRSRDRRIEVSDDLEAAHVTFEAPNLVHYWSVYRDRGVAKRRVAGLALYSLPLGKNKCRLLYRAYSNFSPLRDRIRPRFWEHGYQCHLLEQDMAVLIGQVQNIAKSHEPLSKSWLPLKSSDALVTAYRKWIDAHAADRPDAIGFRTRGLDSYAAPEVGRVDRLSAHVHQCSSCQRALVVARRARRVLASLAFVSLAAAVCFVGSELPVATPLALLGVLSFLSSTAAAMLCRRLTGSSIQAAPFQA